MFNSKHYSLIIISYKVITYHSIYSLLAITIKHSKMDRECRMYTSTSNFLTPNKLNEIAESAQRFANRLQTQDIIGIVMFLALLPIGFIYAITFPLSFWCELFSKEWFIRVIPLALLGINVYLNALMLVRVGPNSRGSVLPSVVNSGYIYCHQCQLNSPPRSFHCPVCDTCMRRRDHHCSFTGSCVGHFNQRYFVAAAFNLWPIAVTCCIWNWYALQLAFPSSGIVDMWKWMFPHVALALRFITLYQFFMTMAFALSFFVLIFDSYMIGAQLFCLNRGQTRVEYLMDIHAYNIGLLENIRQALGTRWPLIFISPFIPSPLESDGTSFRTKDRETVGKTMKYY